jgi:hypothetical protein
MCIRKYITPVSFTKLVLKFIYAPVQFSDIIIVWYKLINFIFQILPFLLPEMPTSFPPYFTQVVFIHYTWVLQPL